LTDKSKKINSFSRKIFCIPFYAVAAFFLWLLIVISGNHGGSKEFVEIDGFEIKEENFTGEFKK